MRLWLTFLLLLCCFGTAQAVSISEVMPNPYGPEPAGEWIELYTNSPVSLINWSVKDAANKKYNFSLSFNSYAILACNESHFRLNYPSVIVPIFDLNCTGSGWLNNGEETLYLYDENGVLIDKIYWDGTKENYSLSLCQGALFNTTPTPGEPNNCPAVQRDVTLEVYLSPRIVLGQKYTSLFKIKILNKQNCSEQDNVSVLYNVTDSSGNLVLSGQFERALGCSGYANTGFWQPNQTGQFTLCGVISSTTCENSEPSNDFACANITVLPSPLQIIYFPQNTSFGSLNFLFGKIEFDDVLADYFNINQSDLSFLVYSLNESVLRDLNDNIIYSVKGCNSPFAVKVQNVSANSILFLMLPFFLTSNCDDYYPYKNYSFGIRAFKLSNGDCPTSCSSGDCIDLGTINVYVSGKNSDLCPKTIIKYEEQSYSGYSSYTKAQSKTNLSVEILQFPSQLHAGDNCTIVFRIINSENSSKDIEVYSYVFSGLYLASGGNWTSNKIKVTILPNSSLELNLSNLIRKDVNPGNYSWRVRVAVGDEKIDATVPVLILSQPKALNKALPVSSVSNLSLTESIGVNLAKPPSEVKVVWYSSTGLKNPIILFCLALLILCISLLFTFLSQKS